MHLPMIYMQQKNYLDRIIREADYEHLKACLKRDGEHLHYFVIRYMAWFTHILFTIVLPKGNSLVYCRRKNKRFLIYK